MVCMGNICRSPLAHGILEHKLKEEGMDWQVDSAGTGGWHAGEKPDMRSVQVAHAHGVDISMQRARRITTADIADHDLVYCMDSTNYNEVIAACHTEEQQAKVHLIMNEAEPGRNINVPDPYYGGPSGFEDVYQMLDRACSAIIDKRR